MTEEGMENDSTEAGVHREGRLEKAEGWFNMSWKEKVFKLKTDGIVEYYTSSFVKGKTTLVKEGAGQVVAAAPTGWAGFQIKLQLRRQDTQELDELTLRAEDASRALDWIQAFNRFATT